MVYYLLVFNKWSGKSGLCWINDRPATLVFFCAPMLFVCVANIILYVLTVSSIDYVSSLTQVFTCFVFRNNIITLSLVQAQYVQVTAKLESIATTNQHQLCGAFMKAVLTR